MGDMEWGVIKYAPDDGVMVPRISGMWVQLHDYDRLRAERDALREAAGRVTCKRCNGLGILMGSTSVSSPIVTCPDCAALRKLLNPEAK